MESLRHKRSKSDAEKRVKRDFSESPSTSSNLKEILQLEKRLKNQQAVRLTLEKALGSEKTVINSPNDIFIPKPAKELIREIAVLEVEVMHLEQYLLSLYRKAFDQQISNSSPYPPKNKSKQPISCQKRLFQELPGPEILSKRSPLVHSTRILPSQVSACKLSDESYCDSATDRSVIRCHSALNQREVYSSRISPSESALARALHECHSQPLSFLTDWHDSTSGLTSLAEYLGTSITDHAPETPNKISEDMLKCMGAIYMKLADPPLMNLDPSPSPTSSFSSFSAISPQCTGDMWSPGYRNETVLDSQLVNPFCIEGLKEFSGPYNSMVEVSSFRNEDRRLKIVEALLNTYKSLVYKLATINVKKMKNDEKLSFWVNLHNALMMHAYLVYGIPQSSMKRSSLLIKATCIVGGHSVNVDMIHGSFLWGRSHWFGQWLRTFKLPVMKLKSARDDWRRHYAIEKHEPLLHYALCLGSHSDPAVRIYTANRWHQQLETAKEEYIRATVGIQQDHKIFLPKLIEYYAKDCCMNSHKVVDMIMQYLPETMAMAVKRCQKGTSQSIDWVPHNFSFRYLLTREVANLPRTI